MASEAVLIVAGLVAIASALGASAAYRLAGGRVQRAVQAERSRIGRELHDSIAQGMTGIGLHLETAVAMLDEPSRAAEHIQTAKALARTTLLDVKHVLLDLPPSALEGHELTDALQDMFRNLTSGLPVAICFRVEGGTRNFGTRVNGHVFRIAQEAVTNALRYSGARRIEMVLTFSAHALRLCIRDDGAGSGAYRRADLPTGAGQGIAGMHERARALGAGLTTKRSGRGMEVVLEMPVAGCSGDGGSECRP